ncbi:hypothetical protein Bca4012_019125 [Brassica carinata]
MEEMTSKDKSIRERVAIRCARASRLLYSLASSRDQTATIDTAGEEEGEKQREIEDLRRKLAIEKKRMNRIKLCSLTELLLLVILVLFFRKDLYKNWNLFSVNVAMAGTGMYQLAYAEELSTGASGPEHEINHHHEPSLKPDIDEDGDLAPWKKLGRDTTKKMKTELGRWCRHEVRSGCCGDVRPSLGLKRAQQQPCEAAEIMPEEITDGRVYESGDDD